MAFPTRCGDMLRLEAAYSPGRHATSSNASHIAQLPVSLASARSTFVIHGKVARKNETVSTYLGIVFVNDECIMI